MEELLVRPSAVDPEAADAVRVIAYFDALVAGRAGIEPFVRAAAVLAGCVAGLHDPDRHVFVRIDAEGRRLAEHPPAQWPGPGGRVVVGIDLEGRRDGEHSTTPWPGVDFGSGRVWLERTEPHAVDAIILERLAAGVAIVLDRTRGRALAHDPASVEAILSAQSTTETRRSAARRLTLPDGRVRVVAILPPVGRIRWSATMGNVLAVLASETEDWSSLPNRLEVGPAVDIENAPTSWEGALAALRLTGVGAWHLRYDDLGGLVALRPKEIGDVGAIRAAVAAGPDALLTLSALVTHESLRQAAAALHIHHSTLQDRVKHFRKYLGYEVDTVPGRCRLHVALAMYRLDQNAGLVEL